MPTLIDRIMSGTYRFPELTTIELFPGFKYETSVEIVDNYRNWLDKIQNSTLYAGAIGGRLTFEITPTSVGLLVTVKDSMSKEEFELTCYDTF